MDPIKIIEEYYSPNAKDYEILISHSRSVANLAVSLGENYTAGSLDLDFVYQAAMLHDIGMFYCDAKEIACTGAAPYIQHGYLGADLLRRHALERHALVAERHTGMGLLLEEIERRMLPLPHDRIYYPVSVEERLICYADKFYSKTKLGLMSSIEDVRKGIAKYGAYSISRLEAFVEEFGSPSIIE